MGKMKIGMAVYIGISTLVMFVAVIRIEQLERLVRASARKRIPSIISTTTHLATCVWVDEHGDESLIPEFIASHLAQGILEYTIYVSNVQDQFIVNILSNYTNLGLPLTFLNRSGDKEADIWDCLTENIFNPMTSYVLLTDIDTVIFPLKDRYSKIVATENCVEFAEYEFVKTNEHYSGSMVETHKNRSSEETSVKRLLRMGENVTERIEFLKRFNHNKQPCFRSGVHGVAKYSYRASLAHSVKDDRPSKLRSAYHVPKFN